MATHSSIPAWKITWTGEPGDTVGPQYISGLIIMEENLLFYNEASLVAQL